VFRADAFKATRGSNMTLGFMSDHPSQRKPLYVASFICMGLTALNVLFGLFVALHHVIIFVKFDTILPNQIPVHLYTLGGFLALAATLALFHTNLGTNAGPVLLWLSRIGLVLGVATIATVPGGQPPGTWIAHVGVLEIFSVILPLLFLGYLAYRSAPALFSRR
jgi:hypothetical protein